MSSKRKREDGMPELSDEQVEFLSGRELLDSFTSMLAVPVPLIYWQVSMKNQQNETTAVTLCPLLSRSEAQTFLQVNILSQELDLLMDSMEQILNEQAQSSELGELLKAKDLPFQRPLQVLLLDSNHLGQQQILEISTQIKLLVKELALCQDTLRQFGENNWNTANLLGWTTIGAEKRKLSDVEEELCRRIRVILSVPTAADEPPIQISMEQYCQKILGDDMTTVEKEANISEVAEKHAPSEVGLREPVASTPVQNKSNLSMLTTPETHTQDTPDAKKMYQTTTPQYGLATQQKEPAVSTPDTSVMLGDAEGNAPRQSNAKPVPERLDHDDVDSDDDQMLQDMVQNETAGVETSHENVMPVVESPIVIVPAAQRQDNPSRSSLAAKSIQCQMQETATDQKEEATSVKNAGIEESRMADPLQTSVLYSTPEAKTPALDDTGSNEDEDEMAEHETEAGQIEHETISQVLTSPITSTKRGAVEKENEKPSQSSTHSSASPIHGDSPFRSQDAAEVLSTFHRMA